VSKHTSACNRHGIKCFYCESLSKRASELVCCTVKRFHLSLDIITSFSETVSNTPRYFTWSENCTHTPFKITFDGAGCWHFLRQKITPLVLLQLKAISFSATLPPQIFRRRWILLIPGLNTHISSVNIRWFTAIFPQSIPLWLNPAGLGVHQGKQQIKWSRNPTLPYAIGYSKRAWKVGAPFYCTCL